MHKHSAPLLEDYQNEDQAQAHSDLQQARTDLSPTQQAKPSAADSTMPLDSINQTTLTI